MGDAGYGTRMNGVSPLPATDDWPLIAQLLPGGWEGAAVTLGAFGRVRGIPNPTVLLRTLLVHLADGCSLRETATRVEQAGWCSLSPVALHERLRASGEWLRWMAERLRRRFVPPTPSSGYRLRAVDATTVQEFGSTGTDWRVHYALDLATLRCDFSEVTDARGGETFRRVPVAVGDPVLGDRVYGTPPGIADVTRRGGDVLIRLNHKALPLWDRDGNRIPVARPVRSLAAGGCGEWAAAVWHQGRRVDGRLVALRLPAAVARVARRRAERKAGKKGKRLSAEATRLAGFVPVWTAVPAAIHSAERVLEPYRIRWQVELAFERLKSSMGVGQLPKRSDAGGRAWLHGKLLVALLVERLLGAAETFSPGEGAVGTVAEPVAGGPLPVPRTGHCSHPAVWAGNGPRQVGRHQQAVGRHRAKTTAADLKLTLMGVSPLFPGYFDLNRGLTQSYSEIEGGALSMSRARSGKAAISRVAAGTLGWPAFRSRYTATFRRLASTRGAFPRRTRHRSPPNVSSRVWCSPFSIPQWSRD